MTSCAEATRGDDPQKSAGLASALDTSFSKATPSKENTNWINHQVCRAHCKRGRGGVRRGKETMTNDLPAVMFSSWACTLGTAMSAHAAAGATCTCIKLGNRSERFPNGRIKT